MNDKDIKISIRRLIRFSVTLDRPTIRQDGVGRELGAGKKTLIRCWGLNDINVDVPTDDSHYGAVWIGKIDSHPAP
jgi:hypothetical protein